MQVLEGQSQGIARRETVVDPVRANIEKFVEDGTKNVALTQLQAVTTLTPVQNAAVIFTHHP